MKVKCLSVQNPLSYWIVAGIKDVENRTWTTDYRGEIYIHSSGKDCFHCYDRDAKELFPIHADFDDIQDDENGNVVIGKSVKYIDFDKNKNEFFLKPEGEKYRSEYELFKKCYSYMERDECFFKSQAIIGKINLVDIIKDSPSPFAADGQYHWILKNPVMFDKPILYVKGKLRFFEYDIKNEV